ncbi:hypothetical protein EON65_26260 [archaeon]|nr:MAG: hypothetical protein EON65_26260 [archaeon]
MFQNSTSLDGVDGISNIEDSKENAAVQMPAVSNASAILSTKTTRDGMVQAHLAGLVKNLIDSAK